MCAEKRAIDKPNHLTAGSLQRFPQDNWSPTASSIKANNWRNRKHVVLDLFSNQWLLPVTLWGTRQLNVGHFLVPPPSSPFSRPAPCVAPNTPPCVRSQRPCVYRQHVHMLKSMCACCQHARGRFERTHGDVLNLHTGPPLTRCRMRYATNASNLTHVLGEIEFS